MAVTGGTFNICSLDEEKKKMAHCYNFNNLSAKVCAHVLTNHPFLPGRSQQICVHLAEYACYCKAQIWMMNKCEKKTHYDNGNS